MNKQELNKKLAEHYGFRIVPRFGGDDRSETLWQYPNGDHSRSLPDFIHSLDACFKWLIYPNQGGLSNPPSNRIINWKLSNQEPNVGTYSKPRAWLSYCTLLDKNIWSEWQDSYAEDTSLALALCLAIEKLIDGDS